jgi:DNA-binding transcriptional LysR family regulator
MELDLGLVASFLILLDERHYGRAASRLHMTSSALTKRIQRLELQLGVTLIERGCGGVLGVTAAGRRFATVAVPLLAQADAARETAKHEPARYTLRVGIPALAGQFLEHIDMAGIARDIRCSFPEARLIRLDVPFPAITSCLPEGQVDLLWTIAPVKHPAVDSVPLHVTSERIGVVGANHPLADADTVHVNDFSAEPMLHNPAVPEEWMRPFWLGDVRTRRDACLIETDARDQITAMRHTADAQAVMITLEPAARLLRPHLRPVILTGAAPRVFLIARRGNDRRQAVHALLEAFQALSPCRLR